MREILFKAFHKCEDGTEIAYIDNQAVRGKWVEGFYAFDETHVIIKSLRYEIGPDGKIVLPDVYAIDPATLCQYTGPTDKNGVKIFEGDIVKFVNHIDEIHHEQIGVCVFEQDECNFCLQYTVENQIGYPVPQTTHTVYLISSRTYKDDCWYEIVGSTHDTPELMGENKKEW